MGKKKLKRLAHNRIEVIFEGNDAAGKDVTLPAFYMQLQRVHRLLTKIEQRHSGEASVTQYTVVDLSHSSPARVVIQAHALPKKPDYSIAVMQGFNEALHAVYTGKSIANVDEEILEDLRDIANPIGKQIRSFIISTPKETYEFSEKIAKRIEAELAVDETEHGAVEGMLEQINIHDNQNFFHIYSEAGLKKLKCRFSPELLDAATSAIGRKVSVTGMLKYRANALLPFEIVIQEIEIFPTDSDLPDFEDIRGRAPNIMDGKSSEEFIAELRDGWY